MCLCVYSLRFLWSSLEQHRLLVRLRFFKSCFSIFLIVIRFFNLCLIDSGVGNEEERGVEEEWRTSVIERVIAEESGENSSLILAAKRTRRKDPADNFKLYTGGWNISNSHYLTVSLLFLWSKNVFFLLLCEISLLTRWVLLHLTWVLLRFLNFD